MPPSIACNNHSIGDSAAMNSWYRGNKNAASYNMQASLDAEERNPAEKIDFSPWYRLKPKGTCERWRRQRWRRGPSSWRSSPLGRGRYRWAAKLDLPLFIRPSLFVCPPPSLSMSLSLSPLLSSLCVTPPPPCYCLRYGFLPLSGLALSLPPPLSLHVEGVWSAPCV